MKLHYGWVVVSVGALATCVGMGAMFSLPVFLAPISAATGWSRAGIASAMTLNFVTMGVAAFGWGALSDRFAHLGHDDFNAHKLSERKVSIE